jgi:hypothetical protein
MEIYNKMCQSRSVLGPSFPLTVGHSCTGLYLLMVAIQYNSIGLINTQYRCDYTRAHAGHVML